MKLQDIRQPKVQYNHKTEHNIASIHFWQTLVNYWYFFEIIENHTAKWVLL